MLIDVLGMMLQARGAESCSTGPGVRPRSRAWLREPEQVGYRLLCLNLKTTQPMILQHANEQPTWTTQATQASDSVSSTSTSFPPDYHCND